MARSPSGIEYKKTLPGWEGSTVTSITVQSDLRSFTNQHYPLGAKYYDDQKLGNETKYKNAGECCNRLHKFADTFLTKSLLVVVSR